MTPQKLLIIETIEAFVRIMVMVHAIETFGLTKHYPGGVVGVEDLSLSVEHGEIYGFLGSNGAGKTTTIRMLVNLLFPTGGSARIFGKDIVKHHIGICKEIGYLPSSVRPHKHMTGENFLDYMGQLSGNGDKEYRKQLLDRFEFPGKDLKRKVKEYSSGMARKIALVQSFQHQPKLMIMDEPTEGLDPVMQHTFYELLKEYRAGGGTVFLSSHHLLEVEQVCDRAGIIRNGHLVAVEKIQHIMKHMTRTIHVTFKEEVKASLLESKAWEITENTGSQIVARLTGDIDQVIKLLSRFEVKDMSLPNPSLQDVFLDYYRDETPEQPAAEAGR
jgi:ABC-2 type transport system ATP-binding protein